VLLSQVIVADNISSRTSALSGAGTLTLRNAILEAGSGATGCSFAGAVAGDGDNVFDDEVPGRWR
jgi:hypothetical protein